MYLAYHTGTSGRGPIIDSCSQKSDYATSRPMVGIRLLSIDNEQSIHLGSSMEDLVSDRPSSTRHRAHIVNGVLM
jgi:hypothetical protein